MELMLNIFFAVISSQFNIFFIFTFFNIKSKIKFYLFNKIGFFHIYQTGNG